MGGISTIGYTYQDHFSVDKEVVEAITLLLFKLKVVVDTTLMTDFQVCNVGYVQKPPILDNVIDYDGNVSTNPDNEKFTSLEIGGEYNSNLVVSKVVTTTHNGKIETLLSLFQQSKGSSGDTDIIYLTGVNQQHSGVEIESKVALHDMVDLDLAISFGDWYFDGDAKGDYTELEYNDDNQVIGQTSTEYEYVNNLKVGDMHKLLMLVV